jgi:hypothetical protein
VFLSFVLAPASALIVPREYRCVAGCATYGTVRCTATVAEAEGRECNRNEIQKEPEGRTNEILHEATPLNKIEVLETSTELNENRIRTSSQN